jgi:DNA-binding CsgD family transcriptional regulator
VIGRFFQWNSNSRSQGSGKMLGKTEPEPAQTSPPPIGRVGDMAAMLRVMGPLNVAVPDPIQRQRRLLADLCRLVGTSVGTVPPPQALPKSEPVEEPLPEPQVELSPRLEQTLRHLLNGDSEKEVAKKLNLSKHTVHVYVKALYRRYLVSSRAELLAKHLKR